MRLISNSLLYPGLLIFEPGHISQDCRFYPSSTLFFWNVAYPGKIRCIMLPVDYRIYYNIPVDTTLLQTKLFIPQIRPPIVSRPQLLERLNAELFIQPQPGLGRLFGRKLTLISAPAGFGKSTLLAEWVSTIDPGSQIAGEGSPPPLAFAWLSLDERDNDLTRFLTYLVAALQGLAPDTGQIALSALSSPESPSMEAVLTSLINEIARLPLIEGETNLPFALVLDDYHWIYSQRVHEATTFLLEHLPPQMHLVIATRADPPIPLARLRGRGQLLEFHADDLRFSLKQVGEFLNGVMDLDLSQPVVEDLAAYTEGWIAGLKMAAVSLRDRSPQSRAGIYDGSSRLIGDYLLEEVLQSQPAEVQSFLLQTSILDRLCDPLCDAVTGRPAGQPALEQIERANLFLLPLDVDGNWYRYHHLFAALLQKHLEQTDPATLPLLHHRASAWYAANDLPAPAIEHALAAGEAELAATLIEEVLDQTLRRGEFVFLLGWLDLLPPSLVNARPRLGAYHALVMILAGRPLEEVETKMRRAAENDTRGLVSGQITLLQALLAVMRGDGQRGYDLSLQALELLPEEDRFLQSLLFRNLAMVYKLTGDVRASRRAIEESARIAQTSGDVLSTIVSQHLLADVCMLSGQLHEALLLYQSALELAVDQEGRPMLIAAKSMISMGEVYREWNELETAASYLTRAIDLVGQWAEIWSLSAYIILARVRQAQGDLNAARKSIQIARQMAISYDSSEVDDLFVAAYQARMWLLQDNLDGMLRWAQERGLEKYAAKTKPASPAKTLPADAKKRPLVPDARARPVSPARMGQMPYYLQEFELITLARLYLAQGRFARAEKVLRPVLEAAEDLGRSNTIIEIMALQALALQGSASQGRGDFAEVTRYLKRALTLAEPGGYVRLFVEMGPEMGQLLARLAQQGFAPDYSGRLLSAFDLPGEMVRVSSPGLQPLLEPLSERELEVLRLLTTHLTSTEIAFELSISANTVRFHTKNIYSKLGVHSRAGAVTQARALALL